MEQKRILIKRTKPPNKKKGLREISMNKTKLKYLIHPMCEESGCLKYMDRKCIAFEDPYYQWEKFYTEGKACWGLCQKLNELQQIYEAMEFKSLHYGGGNIGGSSLIELKECILRHANKEERG